MWFRYNSLAALYLFTPDIVCSHLTRALLFFLLRGFSSSVNSFPNRFFLGILILTNSFCNPWKPKSTLLFTSWGHKIYQLFFIQLPFVMYLTLSWWRWDEGSFLWIFYDQMFTSMVLFFAWVMMFLFLVVFWRLDRPLCNVNHHFCGRWKPGNKFFNAL